MKHFLLFSFFGLLLLSSAPVQAQRHRHTPVGVEAFSDTTSVPASKKANLVAAGPDSVGADSADAVAADDFDDSYDGMTDGEAWQQALSNLDSDVVENFLMVVVFAILAILLLPLLFIGLLIWFVVRNRRNSRRLEEEAERYEAEQRQQPDTEEPSSADDSQAAPQGTPRRNPAADRLYSRGIRQIFLGIGLCILLYYMMGGFGFGIGALVACMGVGDYWIARSQRKRDENNPQ